MHCGHSHNDLPQGLMQKASPLSKGVLLIVLLIFVAFNNNVSAFSSIVLVLLFLLIMSGLRFYQVALLSIVPMLSAFAFAHWQVGQGGELVLIMARSMTGVLAALTLFLTSDSYRLMGMFNLLLPDELADGVYLTYRSVFILADRVKVAFQGLQVRGLYNPRAVIGNLPTLAGVFGNVLCEALDGAELMGKIMTLRGVSSSIAPQMEPTKFTGYDLIPVGVGLWAVILLISTR